MNLELLYGIILGICWVLFFLFPFFKKNKKLDIEIGHKELYCDTLAAVRFEYVYMTQPFVRVSIYENFLLIRGPLLKMVLEYSEIVKFEDLSGDWKWLQIFHKNLKYTAIVKVMSENNKNLVDVARNANKSIELF